MAERTRILLLIPHLGGGGAEQVIALLARGLTPEKYEVHLGLVTARETGTIVLPRWVTTHALGSQRVRFAGWDLLRLVWRVRPAVILSGAAEVSFLALLLRPLFPRNASVLVRQNGTASAALASCRLPRYTRMLYRVLYRQADRVICQSQAMALDLAQVLGACEEQIAVLPNPIDIEAIQAAASTSAARIGKGPHLLAVGRLSEEKGFDLLLEAVAKVRERFPGVDLILAGAGPEEAALRAMSRALRLDATVSFIGHVDCVYAFFPGTTLFVLPSRYEGMPNALLEAAAAGLPLVATPASGGVVDLLRDRQGAWLTQAISAESLADTLITALSTLHPGERFRHAFLSFARG